MIELSQRQAREALVRWHNLDGADGFRGLDGARAVMDRLGTIQFDPLNVAGRNAELVLQARVRGFKPEHLRRLLYEERFLVDGFDKLITARTGIHTIVAENAISCVAEGTGRSLDSLNSMTDGTVNLSRRRQMN